MRRLICTALAFSLFAYSPALKANSFDSDQEEYITDNANETDTNQEQYFDPESDENNYGDEAPESAASTTTPVDSNNVDSGTYTDQETEVGSESPYAAQQRTKRWQNILIAAGAIIVAVAALLIVHSNQGHDHNPNKH